MNKFAIVSATVTFGALLASAPVQAGGGQMQKDGKCFVPAHTHSRDLGFGYWSECTQPASNSVGSTANTHSRAVRHRSTS
jgi:hypothetical protein